MRGFYIFIFFAFTIFHSYAQQLPYDPNEYVEWNEHYRLSWDVFLGEADEDRFGDAGTAVKIQANPHLIGREVHYEVYALFSKHQSWCKEKSSELLEHEQLHFDIAELTARQVRKEADKLRRSGEKDPAKYNAVIKKVLKESNVFDSRYDKETLHGLLADKQQEWQDQIKAELDRLSAYAKQKERIGSIGGK